MKECNKNIKVLKVRGSSVLEVIIALLICLVIFTVSVNILLNIRTKSSVGLRQKSVLLITQMNAIKDSTGRNDQLYISVKKIKIDSLNNVSKIIIKVQDRNDLNLTTRELWVDSDQEVLSAYEDWK